MGAAQEVTVTFPLLPVQGRALGDLRSHTICVVGGYASGKSVVAGLKGWQLAELNAPVPILFVEPSYEHIERVAWEILRELFGRVGLLPYVRYNRQRREVTWPTSDGREARIWFVNGADAENKAGPTVAGAIVDEAGLSKIKSDVAQQILARVRSPDAKMLQVVCLGTPDQGKRGWFYELACREDVRLLRARTTENHFLPEGYVDQRLAGMDELNRRRYCDGEFVDLYGRVYTQFDEERHIRPTPSDDDILERHCEHVMMCDFGAGIMAWSFGLIWKRNRKEILHITGEQVLEGSAVGGGVDTIVARDMAKERLAAEYTRIYRRKSGEPITPDEAAARTVVYADASSKNASASDISILEQGGFRVRTHNRNPRVRNRVNAVQRKFSLDEFFIDDKRAPYVAKCFRLQGYDQKGEPEKSRGRIGSKGLDHGCFVAGTLVETSRGPVPIEQVMVGDQVWTRAGLRLVTASWCTGRDRQTVVVKTEAGRAIRCTPDHPFYVDGEWVRADNLTHWSRLTAWPGLNASCSTASRFAGTRTPSDGNCASTSPRMARTARAVLDVFTRSFGSITTGRSPTGMRSTTSTRTPSTTTLTTSSVSQPRSTSSGTATTQGRLSSSLGGQRLARRRRPGTHHPLAAPGTASTVVASGMASSGRPFAAHSAAGTTSIVVDVPTQPCSVAETARRWLAAGLAWTTRLASALSAAMDFRSTGTCRPSAALDRVQTVSECGTADVFNLTVEGEHEFFANGVLVHNCDGPGYLVEYRWPVESGENWSADTL